MNCLTNGDFLNPTTDYTNNTDESMIHEELSREIIGAAMIVKTTHNLAKSRRPLPVFVMSSEVETSLDSDC